MRLFIGIAPARHVQPALERELSRVQRELGDLGEAVRWTPPGNLHITMHFLGEVAAAAMAPLTSALGRRVDEAPFEVELDAVGAFASRGRAKAIWISIGAGQGELVRLHAELGRRLTRGVPELSLDERPFAPHVTLGRVRDRQQRRARHLLARLVDLRIEPIRWWVDRCTLFASDLSGSRPVYRTLHEIVLRDRPDVAASDHEGR